MGRTQKFVKRSTFDVSSRELFDWHARPNAFLRLTPPWEKVELIERTGDGIGVGTRLVMRMSIGPVSRLWVAEHTALEDGTLFRDEQKEGPFAKWVHTHRFISEGPDRSVLEDELDYQLPLGALGQAFGSGIAGRRLQRMFDYRHLLTRLDLERHKRFAAAGPRTIAITGASGLVGSALGPFLTTGGHTVKRLVRRARAGGDEIAWNPGAGELGPAALDGVDGVVNLAGATVSKRWTPEYKREIRDSRIKGTRLLCETMARMPRKPRVLVNASAVGIYGDRGEEELTEASAPGNGFLAEVTREWEEATAPAREAGIRVVLLRIGMVLSPAGGALGALLPPFKAGAGGPVGSGKQWQSWISIEDLVGAIHFALMNDGFHGPANAVAGSLTNRDFSRTLAHVLHRPSVMPLPGAALGAVLGEMGRELLLAGQRVRPAALEGAGFHFAFPELEGALRFLLGAA